MQTITLVQFLSVLTSAPDTWLYPLVTHNHILLTQSQLLYFFCFGVQKYLRGCFKKYGIYKRSDLPPFVFIKFENRC